MSISGVVGALIAQGPVDRYRPMGVFGRPAYESHVQLRAALLARLGPRYANYFSRPTFDADKRHVRWTAELAGPVTAWRDLDDVRRQQLEPALAQIRSGLQAYVDELKGLASNTAKGGGGTALASLIEQATKVPDDSHLHLVGEQPVLSFWGFENQAGHSVDAALLSATPRLDPAQVQVVSPQVAPAPVVAPNEPARRRHGAAWWLWLLGLLLLLLLALLLAWLLRCSPPLAGWFAQGGWPSGWWPALANCSRPPPVPVPQPPIPPPKPDPEPPKPPPPKPDPSRLAIPEDALKSRDLSFLGGKWEIGPRMQEVTPDGRKLGAMINSLRFDAQGRGSIESVREGGFGPCRGPAKAWIEDGKLRIETGSCVGSQRSLVGMSMSCERLTDGSTQCSGRNTGQAFKGSVSERFRTWLSKKE